MKKIFLVILSIGIVFAVSAQSTTMYVAVKNVEVKASAGFLANTLGTLQLGASVTVLQKTEKWIQVRTPTLTGWIAADSLSSKRVAASGRSASADEIALAGKGFTEEVEQAYQQEERVDFSSTDRMEAQKTPQNELLKFLSEGELGTGE